MTDEVKWQPDDLALCVKVGAWHRYNGELVEGEDAARGGGIYLVRAVGCEIVGTILWFDGIGDDSLRSSYSARFFRKITPPAADEFDREVIGLMKSARVSA